MSQKKKQAPEPAKPAFEMPECIVIVSLEDYSKWNKANKTSLQWAFPKSGIFAPNDKGYLCWYKNPPESLV
jgi:hypothetical protein